MVLLFVGTPYTHLIRVPRPLETTSSLDVWFRVYGFTTVPNPVRPPSPLERRRVVEWEDITKGPYLSSAVVSTRTSGREALTVMEDHILSLLVPEDGPPRRPIMGSEPKTVLRSVKAIPKWREGCRASFCGGP